MEYNTIIATKKDLNEVYKYLLKIDKEFPVSLSEKVDVKKYCDKIFEKGIVILIKNKTKIIGILTGYINDYENKIAYISILEVDKEYRNLGIAEKLFRYFEGKALQNGMKKIRLYTHKENEKAKKFYKKMNFGIDNEGKANYDYSIILEKNIRCNILLTSVGRRAYLVQYFKEALKERRKGTCV